MIVRAKALPERRVVFETGERLHRACLDAGVVIRIRTMTSDVADKLPLVEVSRDRTSKSEEEQSAHQRIEIVDALSECEKARGEWLSTCCDISRIAKLGIILANSFGAETARHDVTRLLAGNPNPKFPAPIDQTVTLGGLETFLRRLDAGMTAFGDALIENDSAPDETAFRLGTWNVSLVNDDPERSPNHQKPLIIPVAIREPERAVLAAFQRRALLLGALVTKKGDRPRKALLHGISIGNPSFANGPKDPGDLTLVETMDSAIF
jgi:hypothetical protein